MVTLALSTDINLLAVAVAAAVVFAMGAVWYSPLLFGDQWQKMTLATYKSMSTKTMRDRMPVAFVGSGLAYLITAYVLDYLNALLGVKNPVEGMIVAAWVAFGFVLTHGLVHTLYHNVRRKLWAINVVYEVASLLAMGLLLGAWR